MLKAILRTTLFAGAAYAAYTLAKKYYPSQVDSAIDSAKSFANDSVRNLTEQSKNMANPSKETRRAV
jgi:hypothetical protein